MKNCLILLVSIAYCTSMIACEGPRTRSMTRRWRAVRDAMLAEKQPWAIDNFNEESRELLYRMNLSILEESSKVNRQNAEVMVHSSFTSWILGALCLGIGLYENDPTFVANATVAKCASCSCVAFGLFAGIMACKECQRAREEARELSEMQSREI